MSYYNENVAGGAFLNGFLKIYCLDTVNSAYLSLFL